MLEFLTSLSADNAISILKDDHDKVQDIFEQFEESENRAEKKKLVAKALEELKIHATIEEEIFYPAVRAKMDDKDLMNEANEEHHVAKLLVAELDNMKGNEEHYDAKFIVLAENIRHHIREEEGEMFPKVRALGLDLEAIGRKMLARKAELKKNGVPASAEEKLIKKWGMKADSPAKAAIKRVAGRVKRGAAKTTKVAANRNVARHKGKKAG